MALITKEENNRFRFIKALNLCGRKVLHNTFCWGTPDKVGHVRLDEYLKNLKRTSSANYLKLSRSQRKFNKTQKKLINKSSDGREFDIPLLCLSIKLACENVAPIGDAKWDSHSTEMEYYITAIKNMRNDALHGQLAVADKDFFENISELRVLLTGCLSASGERYGKDEADVVEEINKINTDLDFIMIEILGEEDILRYCSDDIKQIIVKDSCDKLKEIFQKIIYVNPVSFIIKDFELKVDKIFVDIEVQQGKRGSEGEHVDYRSLLKLVQTTTVPSTMSTASQNLGLSARPQLLLLEGLAGSGKTTLVTLITEEWIQGGQGHITGLDNYEILLWVQCRDPTLNSYQGLLDRLIPDVSTKFRKLLPRIINHCKVLIIVDGLDEMNKNSRSLIKSLLYEFQNSTHTTFICTSRPEKVEMFMATIPENYQVINAELQGIDENYIIEFVSRTHEEINNRTKSNKNIKELKDIVLKVDGLGKHLKLPMNLAFFVYIWDQSSDEINIMTVTETELYQKIHELCLEKLIERIAECLKTKVIDKLNLKYRIKEILSMIYMASLESLSREQLTLEEKTVSRLISACNNHDIPYDEMFSAFLSLKPIWTWQGILERYSAPHKGILDYYSALHIVMTLKNQLQSSALPLPYAQHPTPHVSSQSPASSASLSYTQILPFPSSPTPAPPTPAPPTPAPPTPAPPTPAPPTPAPPTPAPPTPAPPTPAPPVSIREVLEQSVVEARVDITKYHNVLLHVAGLLHLLLDHVPEALLKEVVHLLSEAGMRGRYEDESESLYMNNKDMFDMSSIDNWHHLLENTKYNYEIARAIASFINTENPVYIMDNNVWSCMALLPHLKPCEVHIEIRRESSYVPGLPDLLAALGRHYHRCTQLQLYYHYKDDKKNVISDDILQSLQPR
nr:uncharacterized protein LOC128690676 [Cherax quadricarinatus]